MAAVQSITLPTDTQEVSQGPYPTNGQEAWARLEKGNQRFASGDLVGFLAHLACEVNPTTRASLTLSQNPFAVVITCADSRVAPELVFDEGLGFLFVIRVAGNVMDHIAIGSIDYAVEHLKPSLLVVMGHQSCGAVKAALDCHHKPAHDNVGLIVKKILPAISKAKSDHPDVTDTAQILDSAVKENALATARDIVEHSKAVRDHLATGALSMITAVYYLESGRVEQVHDDHPASHEHHHHHH